MTDSFEHGRVAGVAPGATRRRTRPPLPFDPVLLAAGSASRSSISRRLFGWKRYRASVEAICARSSRTAGRGDFFAGSNGHFRQFWTRDLAMCTPALCRLGKRDRVVRSWAWALERFERAGRITTTIFDRRFPRDVYAYGCDSLPLLLFALRAAGAEHLMTRHRDLLSRRDSALSRVVFDPSWAWRRPTATSRVRATA